VSNLISNLSHQFFSVPLARKVSTLGIVEFAIWIMQSYYPDYPKAQKAVFAKVHFALFYTAIFNALQTILVAFFANRVAAYLWVRTETLELNHYVEVREEFDRVHRQLQDIHGRKGDGNNNGGTADRSNEAAGAIDEDDFDIGVIVQGLVDRIRHPYLKSKYNQLLVQVRFHELRVHFLQSYDLPLKFRVSKYLMRSQRNVLIRLVSVSVVGWLLLTGVANLLYFVMGVVAYYTEDSELVGTSMTWLLVSAMAGFVFFAIVLYAKMKHIFSSIMHREDLWDTQQNDKDHGAAHQQLRLFWMSDPNAVIAAIQFMQFGYAVALSIVIIFWKTIGLGDIRAGWYFFVIFLSYAVFVCVVAQVIPRYTLCTSLGQLVNMQRLQETAAGYRLEEAKRMELGYSERQSLIAGDDRMTQQVNLEDKSPSPSSTALIHYKSVPGTCRVSRLLSVKSLCHG